MAEAVAEAFLTAGRAATLEFSPGIRPTLEGLVARGIRLGIVCDVGFTSGELLRGLLRRRGPTRTVFSDWAFSDEVGHYKRRAADLRSGHCARSRPRRERRCTSATCAAPTSPGPRRWACGQRDPGTLYDDPGPDDEIGVHFVLDSHLELDGVIDRIEERSP